VYKRQLHTASLFVFRADGLPWPTHGRRRIGRVEAVMKIERGFNVIGELGYAVVSDVDAAKLSELASRLAS
jgi:hypothetical protein